MKDNIAVVKRTRLRSCTTNQAKRNNHKTWHFHNNFGMESNVTTWKHKNILTFLGFTKNGFDNQQKKTIHNVDTEELDEESFATNNSIHFTELRETF